MEKGEVFPMCHKANLTSLHSTLNQVYLMCAYTFDPLIKEIGAIVSIEDDSHS